MVTQLEIIVGQKNLSINGKNITLSDNFERAKMSLNEKALELHYSEKKDFSSEEEGERIYLSLEGYKLLDKIDVSPCSEEIYNSNQFPAVTLIGEFSYKEK